MPYRTLWLNYKSRSKHAHSWHFTQSFPSPPFPISSRSSYSTPSKMLFDILAPTLALVSFVDAAMLSVSVGSAGLTYTPNSVTAAAGDTIQFTFSGTHTATQSTFAAPCAPMTGGLDSGL